MSYLEALSFLNSLAPFGMRFGLERMDRLLETLGHPERAFRILHVAGTNGKGSTCAFASSILRAHGLKVGLYTSPHLVRVNERIQVDGQDIPDADFARGVEAILQAFPAARAIDDPLTFFEAGTALALWHFAQEKVDVAVLEVGLGGRLDATNVVHPQVTAVTHIGLDHTAILGKTLGAIAGEKAGIFKPGAKVVLSRQPEEALAVLVEAAQRVGEPPQLAGRDFALEGCGPWKWTGQDRTIEALELSLRGLHQRENAETAVAASLMLEPKLTDTAIRQGLASTRWPGRLEVAQRDPLVLLDGAHNPDGARALREAMRALHPDARIHLVFGMLGDKDVAGVARQLVPMAARLYLASPANERALAVKDLEQLVLPLGVPHQSFAGVAEAIRAAVAAAKGDPKALVLVAGSLYVIGEAEVLFGAGA